MSKVISVEIPAKIAWQYPVVVGSGALSYFEDRNEFASKYSKIFIITDTTVATHWLETLLPYFPSASSIVVDPGEENKTIQELEKIWSELLRAGADRKSLIINLGGGVIGDMGGFAAATFMRGVHFIQVPTTLLAQVDASVGGKLAVDFGGGKNCIGVFCQPQAVVADTLTLNTLPERELRSGFAEVIKHGLIADSEYFERWAEKKVVDYNAMEMSEIVTGSVSIKAAIVTRDEEEGGIRKILNFGHTVGHAVESLSLEGMGNSPLLHGEAIAIGMIAEAGLSVATGLLAKSCLHRIRAALTLQGLPVVVSGDWDMTAIMDRMKLDKKNSGGIVSWTLLESIGSASYDQKIDDKIVRMVLSESLGIAE